jgi:hypothetical protein
VAFPFRLSRGNVVTVLATGEEFVWWWKDYVAAIRADGVVTRGEIMRLRVEPISDSAVIARLQSVDGSLNLYQHWRSSVPADVAG